MGVGEEEDTQQEDPHLLKNLTVATMSFIGGFRKEEIDGKSFLIYSLPTQSENPFSSSSSSFSSAFSFSVETISLLFCPTSRRIKENDSDAPTPVNTSLHIPTTQKQLFQDIFDSKSRNKICKFPLEPIESAPHGLYFCASCKTAVPGTSYYSCRSCRCKFHKECVESPFEIICPTYPFLSFRLSYPGKHVLKCFCCKTELSGISFYCPTSKLSMHPVCAMKPLPFVIDHPKRHPHPLTFFPKQAFLPCNVCGLVKEFIPTYLCVSCVSEVHQFVAHQDCVYSPTVIRISRHPHRISFTTSLPSGNWSCGVCRKEVDNNYGAYSCNKCDCYFVHTRCALRKDLWNGEELEGIPEEPEIVVEPFKVIAEGIILHFSHGHHLKLEVSRIYDNDKFCQVCALPIYEGNYYSCMDECDFILHEECANAPCQKYHPLYAHPLMLKVVTNQYRCVDVRGFFRCDACQRKSNGFVYDSDQGPYTGTFRLDLRCASVSEPFEYQGHEDPFFLSLTPEEEDSAVCQICRKDYYPHARKLNCIKCDFVICFWCATLPYKARYKHDKHLLTFQKEKEASDESGWCELCEKNLVYSRKGGFYSCDEYCGTTLHIDCLLGEYPYMKPGQTIAVAYAGKEIQIIPNNTMSRPFCHDKDCGEDRCLYRVVFEKKNKTFCSLKCAKYY